jgi:AcrR family transcriptional regulator
VLAATRELLTEAGTGELTMEAIAARAGVGKQTVYRWWPSKAAVVAEVVLTGQLPPAPALPPDTGDVAADLRAWARERFAQLAEPAAVALVRALAAASADSEVDAARLYDALTGPTRAALLDRLDAAVRQGQLRPDADLAAAADALVGALVYRLITRTGSDAADGLVDVVLYGIAPEPGG